MRYPALTRLRTILSEQVCDALAADLEAWLCPVPPWWLWTVHLARVLDAENMALLADGVGLPRWRDVTKGLVFKVNLENSGSNA